MLIGELSERTGLSRDTLRFYEKRGLIRAIRRSNGYRHYAEDALFLLSYIGMAQALGFTLREISAELPALNASGVTAERIGEILRSKIAEIETRIDGLTTLRNDLTKRLALACPLAAS